MTPADIKKICLTSGGVISTSTKVGISRRSMSRFLSGDRVPSALIIKKLKALAFTQANKMAKIAERTEPK